MISAPSFSRWAGPIIDLLLDYVGHVTLCSRLMEHLNSYPAWSVITDKAGESLRAREGEPVSSVAPVGPGLSRRVGPARVRQTERSDGPETCRPSWFQRCYWVVWSLAAPPRPLLQLCRLRILQLVPHRRLKRLPLPGSLIRFLNHQEAPVDDY